MATEAEEFGAPAPASATRSGSKSRRGNWTAEEDAKLRALVAEHGIGRWPVIAAKIPGRTGKSCRLRWLNQLEPSLSKAPFTQDENLLIISAYVLIGPRWSQIAQLLKGRSDNAIKNHWHSHIKRRWTIHLLPEWVKQQVLTRLAGNGGLTAAALANAQQLLGSLGLMGGPQGPHNGDAGVISALPSLLVPQSVTPAITTAASTAEAAAALSWPTLSVTPGQQQSSSPDSEVVERGGAAAPTVSIGSLGTTGAVSSAALLALLAAHQAGQPPGALGTNQAALATHQGSMGQSHSLQPAAGPSNASGMSNNKQLLRAVSTSVAPMAAGSVSANPLGCNSLPTPLLGTAQGGWVLPLDQSSDSAKESGMMLQVPKGFPNGVGVPGAHVPEELGRENTLDMSGAPAGLVMHQSIEAASARLPMGHQSTALLSTAGVPAGLRHCDTRLAGAHGPTPPVQPFAGRVVLSTITQNGRVMQVWARARTPTEVAAMAPATEAATVQSDTSGEPVNGVTSAKVPDKAGTEMKNEPRTQQPSQQPEVGLTVRLLPRGHQWDLSDRFVTPSNPSEGPSSSSCSSRTQVLCKHCFVQPEVAMQVVLEPPVQVATAPAHGSAHRLAAATAPLNAQPAAELAGQSVRLQGPPGTPTGPLQGAAVQGPTTGCKRTSAEMLGSCTDELTQSLLPGSTCMLAAGGVGGHRDFVMADIESHGQPGGTVGFAAACAPPQLQEVMQHNSCLEQRQRNGLHVAMCHPTGQHRGQAHARNPMDDSLQECCDAVEEAVSWQLWQSNSIGAAMDHITGAMGHVAPINNVKTGTHQAAVPQGVSCLNMPSTLCTGMVPDAVSQEGLTGDVAAAWATVPPPTDSPAFQFWDKLDPGNTQQPSGGSPLHTDGCDSPFTTLFGSAHDGDLWGSAPR